MRGGGRGGRKRRWRDREMEAAAAMGEDGSTAEAWGEKRLRQGRKRWTSVVRRCVLAVATRSDLVQAATGVRRDEIERLHLSSLK